MKCALDCRTKTLRCFYRYGYFLASHPAWFLVIPVLVCGGLGAGFLFSEPVKDIGELYVSTSSKSVQDRNIVVGTFRDRSANHFNSFSPNLPSPHCAVIFRSKQPRAILTDTVLNEIQTFYQSVMAITMTFNEQNYTFEDLCVRQFGSCYVGGALVLSPDFRSSVDVDAVTYPMWNMTQLQDPSLYLSDVSVTHPMWNTTQLQDLSLYLSDVTVTEKGTLTSAGSLKLIFILHGGSFSQAWEQQYIRFMETYNFTTVTHAYSTTGAMSTELDEATQGDIVYYALTFTFMITFVCVVSSGGDCVSTRVLLAIAGVLAAVLGMVGALGLMTLCGVNFVNTVGAMPFLIMGIGVDDMFLLMNSWSETLDKRDLTMPERIGTVFQKAGIGITITSVTDFLAFAIGASSVFLSVRNFCLYTGMAVLLCYICNATFFGACLTYHGYRVYSKRHTVTCRVLESPSELRQQGRHCCFVRMCGGKVPDLPSEDQSVCEKGPKSAFIRFIMWNPVRCVILLVFAGYLAVSIWGCTLLRQGLELKHIARTASFYHKYETWNDEDFKLKLSVSFVTIETQDYRNPQTLKNWQDLIATAQQYSLIDPQMESCWFFSFAKTKSFNASSDQDFFSGLRVFLTQFPFFQQDIVFGENMESIIASRCHIYSYKLPDFNEKADLLIHTQKLAASSPAKVFSYNPEFVLIEQDILIMPQILQTVGMTLAVMFVVTCIFLPHPLIVTLVMIQVMMIVTGIFGFMAFWDLTLSTITMILLIMSVGFSVDFCAHVCTAYMISEETSRQDRAREAIVHASGPILNGGLSSMVGVIVLLFTESYIFQSFFKIMLLVISFGVIHAVFLIPVILSFIGPCGHINRDDDVLPHTDSERNKNKDTAFELVRLASIDPDNLPFNGAEIHKETKSSPCTNENLLNQNIYINKTFEVN